MKIFHFIYFVFTLLAAVYSFTHPAYNWDMLGYTACVLELSGVERDDLHAQTYQTVKSSIPQDKYQKLVSSDVPFRVQMANRPEDFLRQIQISRVKPLYIYSVFLISRTGLSITNSAVLLSALSVALICLLVYRWMCRWFSPPLALVLSIMSFFCTRLIHVARLITPDALSILVLLCAAYLLFERYNIPAGISFLLTSIFIRPDNVIVVLIIVFYTMFWANRGIKIKNVPGCFLLMASLFCTALVFYLPAGKLGTPLHGIFLRSNSSEVDFRAAVSFVSHLKLIELGVIRLFFDKLFLATSHFFIVLGILALAQSRRAHDQLKEKRDIIVIALMTIGVHFLLFPVFEDRFFATYHLLILIASLNIFLTKKIQPPASV